MITTNEVSRQIKEQTSESIFGPVSSKLLEWNGEHLDTSDLMPLLF